MDAPLHELYCEQCGKGYDKADSSADSRFDFCSKACEDAYWAKSVSAEVPKA